MNSKASSCPEALGSASSSQTATIPSPSAIAPLSNDSISNHHQHTSVHHHGRSASVPAVHNHMQPAHFQHIEPHIQPSVPSSHLPHRPDIPVQPNKIDNQSMQMSSNYSSSMDHFEQSYGSQYSSPTTVIHPTMNNQPNVEYNEQNYYNGFYTNYDDQMRPYSASSNSCSSSNSDGDSQMTSQQHQHQHQHHPQHNLPHNNNQDSQQQQQQQHQQRHSMHHQNSQVLVATNTHNNSSHLDSANLSPPEYVDCMDMDQRGAHQSFEVNCFGGIGNVGIHHLSEDLHASYMQNNQHVNNTNGSILLNGNASSGGSVLFNGNNLSGAQDSIQYTSVIVDSNSYHMPNDQYVH